MVLSNCLVFSASKTSFSLRQTNTWFNLSSIAEKEDFERHRRYANEEGCSLENPSLLFINHMYCENALNYAHYFDNIDLTRSISDSHFSYNKVQENMIS